MKRTLSYASPGVSVICLPEPKSLDELKADWVEQQKQIRQEQTKRITEKLPLVKQQRAEFKPRIAELEEKLKSETLTGAEKADVEKELASVKRDLRRKEGDWDALLKCRYTGVEPELHKKHAAAFYPHEPEHFKKHKQMKLPEFVPRNIEEFEFMDREKGGNLECYRMLHRRVSGFMGELVNHWDNHIVDAVDNYVFANYDAKSGKQKGWPELLPAPLGCAVLEDVLTDVRMISGQTSLCLQTLRKVIREHRENVFRDQEEYMGKMFKQASELDDLKQHVRTYKGEKFFVVSRNVEGVKESETFLISLRKATHAIHEADAVVRCGALGLCQLNHVLFWLHKLDENATSYLHENVCPEDQVDLWENCMARKAGVMVYNVERSKDPLFVSYGNVDYVGMHAVEAVALGIEEAVGAVDANAVEATGAVDANAVEATGAVDANTVKVVAASGAVDANADTDIDDAADTDVYDVAPEADADAVSRSPKRQKA